MKRGFGSCCDSTHPVSFGEELSRIEMQGNLCKEAISIGAILLDREYPLDEVLQFLKERYADNDAVLHAIKSLVDLLPKLRQIGLACGQRATATVDESRQPMLGFMPKTPEQLHLELVG